MNRHPAHILSTFQKLGYKVHMDGRLHIGAGMLNNEDHDGKVDGRPSCEAFDETRLGEVTRSADTRESPEDTFSSTWLKSGLQRRLPKSAPEGAGLNRNELPKGPRGRAVSVGVAPSVHECCSIHLAVLTASLRRRGARIHRGNAL